MNRVQESHSQEPSTERWNVLALERGVGWGQSRTGVADIMLTLRNRLKYANNNSHSHIAALEPMHATIETFAGTI